MLRDFGSAHVIAGLLFVFAFPALADEEGDVTKGEKVYRKCLACHAVGPDATNRVGPVLNGIVGKPAGKVAKYVYSAAMKNSGLTWDKETLEKYLKDPKGVVPGTKMVFVGLKKDDDLDDVIAYLASFKDDGTRTE
jgi:cytochrome c